MRSPSWLDRVNQAMGFHEDERVQQVHGNAVRTAYIVMAAVTVPFGMFQEYALQQRGAAWITLAILLASLAVLGVRRVQMNGFGAADERMIRVSHDVFAWPCVLLVMGTWAFTLYQGIIQGNGLMLVAFPLYVLLGVAVVLLTSAWNGTMQGNALFWLFQALFMFALFGWNIWTMVPGTLNVVSIAALGTLLMFGLGCLLIAWRRWQEQRSADHG